MFGTFEAEKPDVEIVYGLVDQPQFWNPVKHQVQNKFFILIFPINVSISTDILLWKSLGESYDHD